jgi:integrase
MGEYLKTRYPGIFQYVGRNGTVYGIDYYSGGKKHREIIGSLLGDAQKKLAERKEEAEDGNCLSRAQKRKITFAKLKEEYEKTQKGEPYFEKSRKYYLDTLQSFFGKDKRLYQITSLEIEKFKIKRKDTPTQHGKVRSEISVNRELETLRHLLNKAMEWGWLDKNPFDRFKKPNGRSTIFYQENNDRTRYLAEDEIRKLLSASPPHLQDIIKAAIFTGLRMGDILRLKWNQVDLEKGIITFKEQKKNDRTRIKFLNGDMIDLLLGIKQRYLLMGNQPEDIFLGPELGRKGNKRPGKPVRCIRRAFKTALEKAGIRDCHFHDLRHTSASHLIMRGASMKAVQEHLNHSSPTMTNRYAHISEKFQQEQIQLLNGLCDLESSKKLVRSEEKSKNEQEAPTNVSA